MWNRSVCNVINQKQWTITQKMFNPLLHNLSHTYLCHSQTPTVKTWSQDLCQAFKKLREWRSWLISLSWKTTYNEVKNSSYNTDSLSDVKENCLRQIQLERIVLRSMEMKWPVSGKSGVTWPQTSYGFRGETIATFQPFNTDLATQYKPIDITQYSHANHNEVDCSLSPHGISAGTVSMML